MFAWEYHKKTAEQSEIQNENSKLTKTYLKGKIVRTKLF